MARGKLSWTVSAIALAAMVGLSGCVTLKDKQGAESTRAANQSAEALAVPAPAWQVGDTWAYSDGYGLSVAAADGGLTSFRRTDDPEQWFSRKGFLRQDAQSSTTLRSVVYRSIPVSAAATLTSNAPLVFTREFTANGKTRVHSTSWVVEGKERISVPAGDFDCYVIVMRTRNPETGWTGFERWWYAPEVRNYVRLEYRYGDKPIGSRVLTGFTPSGAFVADEITEPTPLEQTAAAPAPMREVMPVQEPMPVRVRPSQADNQLNTQSSAAVGQLRRSDGVALEYSAPPPGFAPLSQ